jgi:hypothetical protein
VQGDGSFSEYSEAGTQYSTILDWRQWRPGPWNHFAKYESVAKEIIDPYDPKGVRTVMVPDTTRPREEDRFVEVLPRLDNANGIDTTAPDFKERSRMRVHLPLGDFHEGDECDFFSLVDSRWFSDGVVKHEHPFTGALVVEFDRSDPGRQHSKKSRLAVVSPADAPDRLILNREGRATKILASRGLDTLLAKKKLRMRPLYMPDTAWRQRLAATTPMSVVAGGNIHALRMQAQAMGLPVRAMDAPQIMAMLRKHIQKAQTSDAKKFLASRIAAERDAGEHEPGTSLALTRTPKEREASRALAISNMWLVENRRSNREAGGGDSSSSSPTSPTARLSPKAATKHSSSNDLLTLPSLEETRRQQKLRLSRLPPNVRGPIREEHAVKPHYLGRNVTNDGDDVLDERAGYAAWKQLLYYKGQEALQDEVDRTDDVAVQYVEPPSYTEEQQATMQAVQKEMDSEALEREIQNSIAAGIKPPGEFQEWKVTEYSLRGDVKRVELVVKALEQNPTKKQEESEEGQRLRQQGKYLY